MFKIFDRYIFVEILKSFILNIILFFPMIYLADFFLEEQFSHSEALRKMLFRYGQILIMLAMNAVVLSIKRIRYNYSDSFFITIGFRKMDLLKPCLAFAIFICSIFVFVVVPSNETFFKQQLACTDWGIKKFEDCIIFVNKNGENYEVWKYQKNGQIHNFNARLENETLYYFYKGQERKLKFTSQDFYIVWNEPKKLSWGGLKKCQKYLVYHDLNYDDVTKQFYIFITKLLLILAAILFAAALAWKGSVLVFLLICLLSGWIDHIAIFLPLISSIIFSWLIAFLWFIISLWFLLT